MVHAPACTVDDGTAMRRAVSRSETPANVSRRPSRAWRMTLLRWHRSSPRAEAKERTRRATDRGLPHAPRTPAHIIREWCAKIDRNPERHRSKQVVDFVPESLGDWSAESAH